jgi:PAT family beta-lactamase induction signal transducer AmpG
MPAWLVSEGATASQIGSYLAIVALPWTFKLVTGPLMDRFEYLPMGRRRPWVLGAQAGLAAALLALVWVEDPTSQIGLLAGLGFLVNVFAATQDVATDGMSIDVTPQREQGRLNAFMSFGKAMGWSATAAVSGVALMTWGLAFTAVLAALVSTLGVLAILTVRERAGERILPWTAGAASPVSRDTPSFRAVMGEVNKVLWSRTSVVLLGVMFFDGLIGGYGHALMPFAAVNLFGYTTAQWSQLVAVMGLAGAVVALGLGPLIDRFGAKRMLALAVALVGLHAFTLSQTQHLWANTAYVRTMLSLHVLLGPITMVSVLALAMALCRGPVSATQFAIYMSTANLGGTVGSKFYGMVAEYSTYVQSYALMSALALVMIVVLLAYRHQSQDEDGGRRERPRRATVGVTSAGASAFVSGAIRCPKCRCDMEQLQVEGIEVDRCRQCRGLWFDVGELDAVAHLPPELLDSGDGAGDNAFDAMREYDCPRCAGVMQPAPGPERPHINYETCGDCGGSFLDAGELRRMESAPGP